MKSSRVLLAAGSVCLLLAALPARANPGRAVYVNGHNYKVYIDSSGYITASKGEIIGGGVFVPTSTLTSTYKVCRTYNKVPGEGLAVFWDKIYYAYTADTPGTTTEALSTSCSNPGQNKMSVWVAIIDPGAEPPNVISNRAIGAVTINYGTNSASGAAITVFDNQLYLFTDKGIYTSANGTAWTGPNYPFETSYREPLDAVTIYQGFSNRGPRILIVYGYQSSSANLFYSDLWSATWNGKWYPDQQDYFAAGSPFTPANSQQILGGVSLLPGTACNAPLTGTLCGDSWGAREAAVQLFARAKVGSTNVIQRIEFTYGTSLGLWRVAPTTYGNAVTAFVIYPSSAQQCYPNAPTSWDLRQYININWYEGSNGHYGRLWSDALVPQNRDIPIVNCGDMGGSETNTTQGDFDALSIRQGYWTLVGVILGSPPFAQNGYTAFSDYQNFSNVNYGQDINTGVEQTQSMSHSVFVSTGMEVHAGLENVIGIGASFDVSSKHAWESSNGDTTTQQVKRTDLMGTQNSACTELGKWGWALFEAPIMIYQDWKAYAWDYGQISGLGTALNQDLHTIKIKEVAGGTGFMSVAAYFELANPGGPNDQYPGLMSGMQPFSSSLNTSFWLNPGYSWQSDKRWETKLGEGILPQLQFGGGHSNEVSSSESTQSFDSSGYTKDISYTVGASFSAGSKVNGMTAYLKTGYAGSSRTSTKTTTGFGTQVTFLNKMRSCNYSGPNCVASLAVQPYWLMAKEGAPWVPTAFENQKPWAITWKVWDINPIGGMNIISPTCPPPPTTRSLAAVTTSSPASSSVDAGIAGGRAGTTLPPVHASGRVVSGMGGGEGGEPSSHYALEGGRLWWFLHGTEERIPMTADDFDPSKGVSVQIQERSWSLTTANGTWTRGGDVWTFQPNGNDNHASMKIDFQAATYNLDIQKVDLSGRVPAGSTVLRLLVTVNQKYMFYADLQHNIDIAWRWSQPPADAKTLHVTSIEGRYNTATQAGKASIAGTLPEKLPAFGDIEVNVNEHPYVAQLVNLEDFQHAVQFGGIFRYAKEGLILFFDFGSKTWSVTFNNKAFHELLVPQVGMLRTRLSVGGVPWYRAEDAVLDYSANLTLQK